MIPVSKCLPRMLAAACLLFLLTTVCCVTPVSAYSIPAPSDTFYVNDSADILSEETEQHILDVNQDFCQKTGAQVVVATVPSLEGVSIEEYAYKMFQTYGIGSADKNNGVLILLALEDRMCRIQVGYGLEKDLNNTKTGEIIDTYMIPYFTEDNWDEGMAAGFDAVMEVLSDMYSTGSSAPKAPVRTHENDTKYHIDPNNAGAAGIGLSFIVGLIVGKFFPGQSRYMGILTASAITVFLYVIYGAFTAVLTFVGAILFYFIGWAITSPGDGGGGSGSSHSHRTRRSSGHSSSHTGSSRSSRGGGRTGGSGSSRSF